MLITLTGKSRNKTKQWSGKEFQKKCRIFGSFWLDKKLQITFLPFVANAERIQKQQTKEWSDSEGWWSVEFVTGLQTRTRSLPMAQFLWKKYLNSLKFSLTRETDKKKLSHFWPKHQFCQIAKFQMAFFSIAVNFSLQILKGKL